MRHLVLFLAIVAAAGCSKENTTTPICVQVHERTINLEDSLMIINCNKFALGVNIKVEDEHYTTLISDTLYLQFDTIGTFTLFYYNAGELPASPTFSELSIQVE
jgi:hypothetical protein